MESENQTKRLRIYLSTTDKFRHSPLYEVIVFAAKRFGLTGATVLKGIMGFGARSEVHSFKLWELSEKLPLVIEITDKENKIREFMVYIQPWLEKIKTGTLVTLEPVEVLFQNTPGRK